MPKMRKIFASYLHQSEYRTTRTIYVRALHFTLFCTKTAVQLQRLRSSNSSIIRAQLARKLALLEEERRLEEEARKEQLDRERLMNEQATQEKIERDKQYLARKHGLLIQQDEEDDVVSIRSHRSTHSTGKRIEDWIDKQVKTTSNIGVDVVGEMSKPSEPAHHSPVRSVDAHSQHSTSTPIGDEQIISKKLFAVKSEPSNFIKMDLISPTQTTGSITIEDSDPGEAAGGNDQMDRNSISPAISLVNLTSLQNLLDDSRQTVKNTGTLPKLASKLLLPYGQWQSDTALRLTTAVRARLTRAISGRRNQPVADSERFRKHESDTKKRLQEFSDQQTAMELRWYEEIRRLKDAERRLTSQLHLHSQARQSELLLSWDNTGLHNQGIQIRQQYRWKILLQPQGLCMIQIR